MFLNLPEVFLTILSKSFCCVIIYSHTGALRHCHVSPTREWKKDIFVGQSREMDDFFQGVWGVCVSVCVGKGWNLYFLFPPKIPRCLEIAVEMNNIALWSCFPMALWPICDWHGLYRDHTQTHTHTKINNVVITKQCKMWKTWFNIS